MDRRMRDYMAMRGMGGRDGRNPYGSRGGYVTNRRPDRGMDREDYRRGGDRDRGMDHGWDYRGEMDFDDYADYRQDYGGGYLNRDELEHWEHKLMEELDKSERDAMSREKIIKRAKDLGIKFEEFTEDELAVATLVMYTDYCRTLGKASIDMYVKLAKDFLEDKDAGVRYGEKLAAYFDHIVNV